MSARGWGAGDHESGTEREPRRPSGRQCCQMCLHILHTRNNIHNTYEHKEQAKRKPKTTTTTRKIIWPTMLSNESANKQAAHTAHTEIDVQSTGREETKTIWSTLSKEIMSASTSCSTRAHGLWTLWKMFSVFFSLGTFDVLHCRAIQTFWMKRLRLLV